jgi:triacylglycerol lipase
MNTRHLVDPEVAPLLDIFPKLELNRETLPQTRTALANMFAQPEPPAYPDIEVTEYHLPGADGAPDVRILVYIPKSVPRPLAGLLWIHGGGYVIGSANQDDLNAKNIVTQVGCAVVSVDYRLAPETPHPGPVEDCYTALKWLYTNASELGVDPNRLAIGGASAGGGLSAALALLTRDRGEIPLAFQLLIYPMLDDRTAVSNDPHPYTGEFIWTNQLNHFGWSSLLNQEPGSEGVSPYAAAARAENLEGLPPAYINVGTLDLFLEENLEYARRLVRAGVPTELHVYPGGYHAFNLMPQARISQAFERDMFAALKRALKIGE